MQPSAGPALPHTHSRAVHWITTALAVAALVGATALVQPADATPKAAARPATPSGPPVAAPNANAAHYPLTCAPGVKVDVVSHVSADLDGDGRPETAVVVRCDSETGTPPSGVYVLSAPAHPGGAPKIAVTLVDPKDDRQISDFRLDGDTVKATVLGFSSDDVARCCPDMKRTYTWEWRGDRYVALPGPAAGAV
ncbi:hypothetical protein RVR_1343 [Actinacidiphila reveromycinica]|uniref:Secreted protein n=1 Tax=Actinacidiphila reveromycinica TaxID=659352 RepID=A0A7U3UP82_9ACTN|nr:hypothetical protein [Streptomyces sp. SN-593]BBA96168.1 hypothetical protein RVR_1343 [Streptomyces sp. SN-593]